MLFEQNQTAQAFTMTCNRVAISNIFSSPRQLSINYNLLKIVLIRSHVWKIHKSTDGSKLQ